MSDFFLPRRKRLSCVDDLAPTFPQSTPMTVTKQKGTAKKRKQKKESAQPAKKKGGKRSVHAISPSRVDSHKGQDCAATEPTNKPSTSVLSSPTRLAPRFDDDDESSELQWSFVKGDIELWQLPLALQDMINAL